MGKDKKTRPGRIGRIGKKNILSLLVFSVALVALISVSVGISYRNIQQDSFASMAEQVAKYEAENIDGDKIEEYYNTRETDEYYDEVKDDLEKVYYTTMYLKFLSVIVPEDDQYTYIFDATTDSLGYSDKYSTISKEVLSEAYQKDPVINPYYYVDEKYGMMCSVFYPIFNSSGDPVAMVDVDMNMKDIMSMVNKFILKFTVIISIICLISICLYYIFLRKNIIRPINLLNKEVLETMDNLQNDNKTEISIHTNDEIEYLADNFTKLTEELKDYIGVSSKLMAEKEILNSELNLAKSIQSDMLPKSYPDRNEISMYASMEPAKSVGGDFYDFFTIDDDHIAIVVGDVSGKGVPASLFMVRSMMSIRSYTMRGLPVEEIFTMVNNDLCEGNESELFTTAWLGIYEYSTGKIIFTEAGHENPVCVRKNGEVQLIKPDRKCLVLGAIEEIEYAAKEFTLEPGESLILYTDGLPEAKNDKDEMYGMDRLVKSADDHKNLAETGITELMKAIRSDVSDFVGEADQFDDLTLLAIKRRV